MNRDRLLAVLGGLLIVVGILGVGAAIGWAWSQTSVAPTFSVGTNGPVSVSLDLTVVAQTLPHLDQQTVITAELAACADFQSGRSGDETAIDIGRRFGVAGQPRLFLVNMAVNTFCFDQSPNLHF